MPTGTTTTGSLADSLPTSVDSARIVREFVGVMVRLSERHDKAKNQGLDWNEVSLEALTASAVTELTNNENFQQLVDTLLSITPTFTQVVMVITDRTKMRISANAAAQIGVLGQNAMNRKKDQDLLTVVQAATTDLGTTGTPMAASQVRAAVARIFGNSTEPAVSAVFTVLHNFGIADIQEEVVAGVGTYNIPEGLTADVYRKGFSGTLSNSEVFHDGNIAIDSTPDSQGATFARESLVLVDGIGPRADDEWKPRLGGGSHIITLTDEYGAGERSSGNWMFSHTHDGTVPS